MTLLLGNKGYTPALLNGKRIHLQPMLIQTATETDTAFLSPPTVRCKGSIHGFGHIYTPVDGISKRYEGVCIVSEGYPDTIIPVPRKVIRDTTVLHLHSLNESPMRRDISFWCYHQSEVRRSMYSDISHDV